MATPLKPLRGGGPKIQRNSASLIQDRDVQNLEQLSPNDLGRFVRVDLEDGGTIVQASTADPEVGKDGAQIIWMENAKTGMLVPVRLRLADDGGRKREGGEVSEGDDGEDVDGGGSQESEEAALLVSPPALQADVISSGKFKGGIQVQQRISDASKIESIGSSQLAHLIKVAFFLCQGLLAGFAFSSTLAQNAASSNASFLVEYRPLASEYRRLFYILSSLSAVGSLDTFMSTLGRANRPSLSGQGPNGFGASLVRRENQGSVTIAAAAAILHFIAFILTVIITAFDVLLSVRNGSRDTSDAWAASALSDATFASSLATWRNIDTGRLITAFLAWVCCCLLVWRDLSSLDTRGKELVRLKDILVAWRERSSQLQGDDGLDDLDASSLKKLIALQSMGYERANAALRVQEDLVA
jgi:hypothetical protein